MIGSRGTSVHVSVTPAPMTLTQALDQVLRLLNEDTQAMRQDRQKRNMELAPDTQ